MIPLESRDECYLCVCVCVFLVMVDSVGFCFAVVLFCAKEGVSLNWVKSKSLNCGTRRCSNQPCCSSGDLDQNQGGSKSNWNLAV